MKVTWLDFFLIFLMFCIASFLGFGDWSINYFCQMFTLAIIGSYIFEKVTS